MIQIPKQLQLEGINFVLLEKGGKKPFQQGWQKKEISYNNQELLKHISSNGNYGVMGGGSAKLILVDFDNADVQDEAIQKLPETFTVKTGSGLLHLYYRTNKHDSFKIFDEEMNTLADVQGIGKQVVGPNSVHPNGNRYEIISNKEIAFIDYAELKAILIPYDKKPKKEEKKIEYVKDINNEDSFLEDLKHKLSIRDVLNYLGVDTSINPTQCPMHHSKGGKCLGFERETAHCFHCDGSWNIFSLIKDYKKCDFKEALVILADLAGMQKELEESKKRYIEKLRKEDNQEKESSLKKASRVFTQKGQAENFADIQPLFYDKTGSFWLWDNVKKKYERVDDVDILNMIADATGHDIISSKSRTELLNSLKQEGRKRIPKKVKPTWIQFKDKIFDFSNGEEFEASPDYFVTNPIPYALHQEKFIETPKMDKIFEEWVGRDYVKTLYEILAYCLIPDYPIQRLFCFVGGGMNGKSKFLELLRKFIGDENVTTSELDTLLKSRFEISRLHKKLVCQMGETNFAEMDKTSILKKLTGGDLIGFEYKNKDHFEDMNYAKIIISTNNLPTTTDKTLGFYRRWLIIDFPNQFSEKKDILAEIPEEEYEILAVKCCGILKDLLDKREFHNEGSVEERMERYEHRSNPFDKFWEQNITEDYDSNITLSNFKKKLNEWCKENRFRELSEIVIKKHMAERGIEQGRFYMDWYENDNIIKKQVRGWMGIAWK